MLLGCGVVYYFHGIRSGPKEKLINSLALVNSVAMVGDSTTFLHSMSTMLSADWFWGFWHAPYVEGTTVSTD